MRNAKIICAVLIALAIVHFGIAIFRVGIRDGAGTDVFFVGYFANPWQAVIDFDLMAGLTLIACWVLWRESDRATGIAWVIVMLYWGNLIVAIYVYRQLTLCDKNWARLFLGRHAERSAQAAPAPRVTPPALRLLFWAAAIAVGAFVIRGCFSAGLAPAPLMGYIWGFGGLIPALLLLAKRLPER